MSAGDVLVDDHLLLRVLLDDEPPALRSQRGAIATTGLWYHRLCRALADDTVISAMSSSLGTVDVATAGAAVRAVVELPEAIGLISLRSLGWPMAALVSSGARLNLMSLEAVAAAEHLDAAICLAAADDNANLRAVAETHGVPVRSIA